ncbi:C-type lectin domain family 4 member D, partial [Merops nubicus]
WMCCPKGWRCFQDKCYYLPPDTMSWGDSEKNCTGMGSHLVVVNSKAEQVEAATDAYETKYYLGLAADERGRWRWVDRSPYVAAEAFWKPGEPNLLFAEKCAAI